MAFPYPILYEDNHLLAVIKPAGLATMGVPRHQDSLLTLAKRYVKRRYQKPGDAYLGVVSRLDTPVTGVVLLARTSKASRRLNEQFRAREVQKIYWAIVEGTVRPSMGDWVDWLLPDKRFRRMNSVRDGTPGAKEAKLLFRRLELLEGASLVEVELETGRKHQIRVQFAQRGHPVLGDRKYGARERFPAGIALHAKRLVVTHPVRREPLCLEAPLPDAWKRFGLQP